MSKSQKYINIVSILNIIGGAAQIIIGILGAIGAGAVGADVLAQQGGDAASVTGFVIALIVAGAFSLICGILGVRAAKDASKIKPVFTLACISLAVGLIGVIANVISGKFAIGNLTELVAPLLMVICANNVRKQA